MAVLGLDHHPAAEAAFACLVGCVYGGAQRCPWRCEANGVLAMPHLPATSVFKYLIVAARHAIPGLYRWRIAVSESRIVLIPIRAEPMHRTGKLKAILSGFLLSFFLACRVMASPALTDGDIQQIVEQEIRRAVDVDKVGAAVAISVDGRMLFFNFGWADRVAKKPVTTDSLFNLASVSKVFDTTLLSLAVKNGEMSLDDPVAKYIPELAGGGDIRNITLGELATFTSGLSLPQDHPPWPPAHYTWPKFIRYLKRWKIPADHQRGKQYLYSHAGFLLLHVALERRFGVPYARLLEQSLLRPLNLSSTTLPRRGANLTGVFAPSLKRRAVQGYTGKNEPIGKPGNVQGYYHWPGTEQMFSSARDLGKFIGVQLGGSGDDPHLRGAIDLTHQTVASIRPQVMQAQAWEVHYGAETTIGKNGGLNNTSSYIGMMPGKRLGIAILINRGELNTWDVGYTIWSRLVVPERVVPVKE